MHVAVIGAGPGGLVAALQAARRGHDVTLIEARPEVGGMASSFRFAGQRVDLGSHRLHPSMSPEVASLVRELLAGDLCERTRNGRIALAGRFVAFPLDPLDLLVSLPVRVAAPIAVGGGAAMLRAAADGCTSRRASGRAEPASFADAVRDGLGRGALERFYGPFARKLWGVEPAELSGELARRRVSASGSGGVLAQLVRAGRSKGRAVFWYPRNGFGQLAECLRDAALDVGVTLRLGSGVVRLELSDLRAMVTLADGTQLGCDAVLSSLPIATLVSLLDGVASPVPAAVASAASRLETRAMAIVYLAIGRARYTPFDAHYLPGPETIVSRLSEPKNYRDGPDPASSTVLCAEVPCTVGDETWSMPDDRLADRVADELGGIGLPLAGVVTDRKVVRLKQVYPVYRIGFERDLEVVEAWVGAHGRLVTFGRHGLFNPDNTHHVLEMGLAAARVLGDEHQPVDRVAWAADRDRFRGNVVAD